MTEELPYAPRRKRPLSLWNPLDYLVLLYWVFFFPQAIRWYLERFNDFPAEEFGLFPIVVPTDESGRDAIHLPPDDDESRVKSPNRVQRNLAIQEIALLAIVSMVVVLLLVVGMSLPSDVIAVLAGFGTLTGATTGLFYRGVFGSESIRTRPFGFRLVVKISSALVIGVIFGVSFGVVLGVVYGHPIRAMLGGLAIGLPLGLAFTLACRAGELVFDVLGGDAFVYARDATRRTVINIAYMLLFCVVIPLGQDILFALAFGSAYLIAIIIATWRLDLSVLAFLPALIQESKSLAVSIQRASPLPIPELEVRLLNRLHENWDDGLRDCEGLLRSTLQSVPVTRAISRALEATEASLLLPRISSWCDQTPRDSLQPRISAIFLQSTITSERLRTFIWDGLFVLPLRWMPSVDIDIRYDTPARASCAGFFHLFAVEPELAQRAFSQVRDLPFGEEMHANAAALAAAINCQTFEAIGDWLPPDYLDADLLRPGVAEKLNAMGQTAREARRVVHSRSFGERSGALVRALGSLNELFLVLNDCPIPERLVIAQALGQWGKLVVGIARDVGNIEAREQVASPYIVGAPVPAARLVGRESVFDQLRSVWAKPGQRDSLVVYGHRRMGKTSVLKSVLEFCNLGGDSGLAFLNLQTVDWRGSEPLADLCHAIAFALWRVAAPEPLTSPLCLPEPEPEIFQANPLAELRRFLARLEDATPTRRYILALDEYELLDGCLSAAAGTRFVELLRGLTQQHAWLVVALVGLHDLKERSGSFYEAIFAWRSVRVSFLDAAGVADCLQVEDDAFPLAFSPNALARVLDLTGGQPFLVQMIGDGLVQGFNQRLRESIRPPSPTFEAADVDTVAEAGDLYEQGAVYFRGIWQQAGDGPAGQQVLLKALAAQTEGLDRAGLVLAAGLADGDLDAAIQTLVDHDVVRLDGERWRYTVELMRRWVAAGRME